MCGIAGFISSKTSDGQFKPGELLDAMCRAIKHRGPDDQGTVVRGRAALGMRRLAIIDLLTGQQPIFSEDRRLAIVFNGEIYNYLDLKADLESKGYRFRTNSDTETILHAFEEYVAECVDHLRGMFAIAIWNFESVKLFLARYRDGRSYTSIRKYAKASDGEFICSSDSSLRIIYPRLTEGCHNTLVSYFESSLRRWNWMVKRKPFAPDNLIDVFLIKRNTTLLL